MLLARVNTPYSPIHKQTPKLHLHSFLHDHLLSSDLGTKVVSVVNTAHLKRTFSSHPLRECSCDTTSSILPSTRCAFFGYTFLPARGATDCCCLSLLQTSDILVGLHKTPPLIVRQHPYTTVYFQSRNRLQYRSALQSYSCLSSSFTFRVSRSTFILLA